MASKIAILIPYFGKQPSWFPYFILSCKHNPEIDWFFFSDCLNSEKSTTNLRFVKMTLAEFNVLADVNLGFSVNVKNGYKLCDYKPTYGKIFSEYINEYSFWGYGDIDLVYGDILRFLPVNWETDYDILSNHQNFIPGHLCLLRNVVKVNELFTKILSYKEILQSYNYCGFDEKLLSIPVSTNARFNTISKWTRVQGHIIFDRIAKLKARFFANISFSNSAKLKQEIEPKDFTSLIQKMVQEETIRVNFSSTYSCDISFSKKRLKNWEVVWKDGQLFDATQDKEIMYFHFQLSKSKKRFRINTCLQNATRFFITPNGIIACKP